jgi:hypothetical protein
MVASHGRGVGRGIDDRRRGRDVSPVQVFDLEEQQLLSEAGAWGYVAAFCLVVLMALPAVIGIVLGVRGRHLGERRLGTMGIVVNALIAAYLVLTGVGTLLFG